MTAGSSTPTVTAGLESPEAVRAAYTAHGSELFRFVLRGLGDRASAEDVVQETFLRAWRAQHRYDPDIASLRVWLFAIARNTMLDHARGARVRPWHQHVVEPTSADDAAEEPGDPMESLVESWTVREALARLSQEHRTALVETYVRDRPQAEVAAELGVPVGTIRSRVFYGLKALRVALDEIGVEP